MHLVCISMTNHHFDWDYAGMNSFYPVWGKQPGLPFLENFRRKIPKGKEILGVTLYFEKKMPDFNEKLPGKNTKIRPLLLVNLNRLPAVLYYYWLWLLPQLSFQFKINKTLRVHLEGLSFNRRKKTQVIQYSFLIKGPRSISKNGKETGVYTVRIPIQFLTYEIIM